MKVDIVVTSTLPAILQLKDGFSGEPIDEAPITFLLDQAPCAPLHKRNGFYLFADLHDALPHQLDVMAPGFEDAHVTVQAIPIPLVKPIAELIVVLELGPGPAYAYPVGTTLLCGQVTSAGEPLADAEVFALFFDRQGMWRWRKTQSYGSDRASPYLGHYALALPSVFASSAVDLRFTKDGHTPHFDRVAPARSKTTIVGANLQPKHA